MKKLTFTFSAIALLILTACTSPAPETNSGETPSQESQQGSQTPAPQQISEGWTLTSGTPPYADPDPIVYEGNVELTGWVINKPAYVGENVPHFHVLNTDALPKDMKNIEFQIYPLDTVSQDILKSTEQNPVTIQATKIKVNMEGSPMMTLEE